MSILRTTLTAAVVCTAASAQAQLVNPGFETLDPAPEFLFEGWGQFNADFFAQSLLPNTGTFAGETQGMFTDDGGVPPVPTQSDCGLYQDLPANVGEYWQASVNVQAPVALNPADLGLLIIEFRASASDQLISNVVTVAADDSTTPGAYAPVSVAGFVPEGADTVRILLLHLQLGSEPRGEVVLWDDAVLEQVTAPTGLINPSFEQDGAEGGATGWTPDGWNYFFGDEAGGLCGVNAVKQWGRYCCDGNNTSVVFQRHPAAEAESWTARVSTMQVNWDAMSDINEGFLALVFRDANGDVLLDSPVNAGNVGDPLDVWTQYTITEVAPALTATVDIVLGYNQFNWAGGALHYDCAELEQDGSPVATNGDFETITSAVKLYGWEDYGNNVNRESIAPNSGHEHGKMWGNFPDPAAVNYTGVRQSLPASPGDEWEASAWAYLDFADGLLGDNACYLKLNYLDAADAVLQTDTILLIEGLFGPFGLYIQESVTSIAPAGTAKAEIVIELEQDALNSGGSVYWDDAVLDCLSGDCGANPCVADVTTTGAGIGDPGYGVPDGTVTGADIQYFVNFWVAGDLGVADVTTTGAGIGDPGYGVPDGTVTGADIQYYVNLWVAGCP